MMSFSAFSQTSSTLTPVLIKGADGSITFYAFTPDQARYILKAVKRDQIATQLIDSLTSVVKSYESQREQYARLIDALNQSNQKYYTIKVLYDQMSAHSVKIETDYEEIVKGKNETIDKHRKTIRLLIVSNVTTLALLALLLL